jgi:hypothetical protein
MSFANSLSRLREAMLAGHRGVDRRHCVVDRHDLKELLYHFDRLDGEVRVRYADNERLSARVEELTAELAEAREATAGLVMVRNARAERDGALLEALEARQRAAAVERDARAMRLLRVRVAGVRLVLVDGEPDGWQVGDGPVENDPAEAVLAAFKEGGRHD